MSKGPAYLPSIEVERTRNKHRSFAVGDRYSPKNEDWYVKIKSSKAFLPTDVTLVRDFVQKVEKIRLDSEERGLKRISKRELEILKMKKELKKVENTSPSLNKEKQSVYSYTYLKEKM